MYEKFLSSASSRLDEHERPVRGIRQRQYAASMQRGGFETSCGSAQMVFATPVATPDHGRFSSTPHDLASTRLCRRSG
jgi:hypothetical protein